MSAILWQPRPSQAWGLAAALVIAGAPHVLRLPLELAGLWSLAIGWRLWLLLDARELPSAWLRGLLTLVSALALVVEFGTVLGREAGSALLVVMAGLKLLELRQPRDAIVLVLLAYLLVAVEFMFTDSVWAAGYAATTTAVTTAVWIGLGRQHAGPARADGRLALNMLAQSVPLMLMLFVLFPRLPGPLWSLPSDAYGRTGLSGEMEPGRIGSLASSTAVAFRADFDGDVPGPAQRYWRGPVFEFTDGRRWWGAVDGAEKMRSALAPRLRTNGAAYRYVLTLEPTGSRWLPALEMPAQLPANVVRLSTLELRTEHDLNYLRRETLVSFPDYRVDTEHAAVLTRNRHVPAAVGPRVRALARSLRTGADDDRGFVSAVLRHFNSQPFVYTLNPPTLGDDPTDAFLFETRRGFCEHYAAAFTLLMRAAGIPARVVTGYQGGELNTLGGYLIVRQSDAHAWSEVWLRNEGWVRIDPTAAVAPERIERGIDPAWNADDSLRFRIDHDSAFAQALKRARFAVDAFNYGWNQWVLDYGSERQRALLAAWGFRDAGWRELAWLLALGVGAVCALSVLLLLRPRDQADACAQCFARFRRKLTRRGLGASPAEGPQDLLARIERSQLPSKSAARDIVELYISLRYGPRPDARRVRDLQRAVRRYR